MAQDAFISSLDRTSASMNEVITINGKGFGSNPANLRVFFGGALATIVSVQETIIEAQVPANATYDHVSVINLSTGLHVTSPEKFLLSYSGEDFDLSLLGSQNQFPTTERGVFDFCSCDFDSNGSSDYVVTNNSTRSGVLGEFSIFTNSSSPGTINLSRQNISLDEVAYTDCSDLNGDGLPDLVISEGGDQSVRIYILENRTAGAAISFVNVLTLELPRQADGTIRSIDRIILQDLDENGKVDIIAANVSDNLIDIFENTSTGGTLSFNDTPIQIAIEEGLETSGLDAQDLNNDGFEEIILTPSGNPNIYILPNSSDIGAIKFDDFIRLDQTGNLTSVKAADLNGDSFVDLITVDGGDIGSVNDVDELHVFLNTTGTAGSSIQFERNGMFEVNGNPETLAFGDLNGDGKVDAAVTSRKASAGSGITLMINTTSTGNINFDVFEIPTPSSSRSIQFNDVDNDGRPDILFTHSV
ncbi:MAG: FG-GAP-like repeat-containing protein, partial [Bacteroidota bacterium]